MMTRFHSFLDVSTLLAVAAGRRKKVKKKGQKKEKLGWRLGSAESCRCSACVCVRVCACVRLRDSAGISQSVLMLISD